MFQTLNIHAVMFSSLSGGTNSKSFGVNSQYSLFFLHQRQNNDKQHLENFTTLLFYLGKFSNEQAGDRLLDIASQPPCYFKNL